MGSGFFDVIVNAFVTALQAGFVTLSKYSLLRSWPFWDHHLFLLALAGRVRAAAMGSRPCYGSASRSACFIG